jgi:hypothetical protein
MAEPVLERRDTLLNLLGNFHCTTRFSARDPGGTASTDAGCEITLFVQDGILVIHYQFRSRKILMK